ncbi:DEAD/DEAH box helicase [Altibacter sp.]|uniref:DEAD/DEAH box helicase n=1 Tax=Altibacter sp. TaxID=2024823 RepID=UPI0025897416|nr:DEAD/DEAH box helicase [Altibacter sp.]MCW9036946.1 DEAD/DEAH box helicase [Altibacter sp.]
MHFTELALNKPILKALYEKGYETPTPVQEMTIPIVLEGKDVIASAQTGTGKTAAFALPMLQRLFHRQDVKKGSGKVRAVVVSPTRELAVQIAEEFKLYGKYTNLRSAVVFGGTSLEPQKDILNKGVDILIATPGRLLDLRKREIVDLSEVEILVIDEADLMLDMGFIDDVQKIERLCPESKQILLFSATLPVKVVQLAKTILKEPERVELTPLGTLGKQVEQLLYYVPKRNKIELCLHLLRNEIKGNILIFRRTKNGVDKLEQTLLKNNYNAISLHGDKTQSARQLALNDFKAGEASILIATDVASRGIDIDGLDAVINFDLPNIPETYIHRIGRTGRAGLKGMAYSFCAADEKAYVKEIQKIIQGALQVVEDHPYPLDPKAKPPVHKKKGSKHKKGRKSAASKRNKKRWY